MKETSKLSNAASQATWEVRAVGGHRSKQNKGEKQYFHEMKSYRYGYETPFIKDIFNFNNLKDKRVLEIGVGNGIDAMSMIENGAIYITKKENLIKSGFRYSGKIGTYEMPFSRSFQLDTKDDIIILEKMLKDK